MSVQINFQVHVKSGLDSSGHARSTQVRIRGSRTALVGVAGIGGAIVVVVAVSERKGAGAEHTNVLLTSVGQIASGAVLGNLTTSATITGREQAGVEGGALVRVRAGGIGGAALNEESSSSTQRRCLECVRSRQCKDHHRRRRRRVRSRW